MDRIPATAQEQEGLQPTQMIDELPFSSYRNKLDSLRKDWEKESKETERRRRIRAIDVDIEALRSQKKLKPDETLIAVRVIDENIKKEQPLFVNYLTQSDRLAVFDCVTNPSLAVRPLEVAFTKRMSYSGMMKQLFKWIDGAEAHGWDVVEVTYDTSKPLNCGIEHIGHENLLFSWQAQDVQADEVLMRRFKVTESQLRRWIFKYGFNSEQVENLVRKGENDTKIPEPFEIFKVFIRGQDDIVKVGWASLETKCSDWLKAPAPLDLGRVRKETRTQLAPVNIQGVTLMQPQQIEVEVPESETMFPIFTYIYSENEQKCITDQKGRVFYDRPWQDAQTALRSLVINGSIRASNVYGSPKNRGETGGKITRLDLTLEHGCFYSEPMEFWRTEYPDPAILRAADSLDTRKAAETGQTASAVINREDSRKTATELQTAQNEQGKLSLTPLMLFSAAMREVLSFCWYIVQSQARQNKIKLLWVPIGQDPMGMPIMGNDPRYIEQEYDIKPAGDPDVVRRQERLQREANMVPLMQGTPAWVEFIKDVIRDALPENAEKYITIIDQAEANKDQQILALTEMLKTAVTDESGAIKPEFQKHAPMLQQMFSQLPQQNTTQNA